MTLLRTYRTSSSCSCSSPPPPWSVITRSTQPLSQSLTILLQINQIGGGNEESQETTKVSHGKLEIHLKLRLGILNRSSPSGAVPNRLTFHCTAPFHWIIAHHPIAVAGLGGRIT